MLSGLVGAGLQYREVMPLENNYMESGLKNAGKGLSAITTWFSLGQTIDSVENKDWTGAIVGGWSRRWEPSLPNGLTGPGFCSSLAAMAILSIV